jgi:hypothetical protein
VHPALEPGFLFANHQPQELSQGIAAEQTQLGEAAAVGKSLLRLYSDNG